MSVCPNCGYGAASKRTVYRDGWMIDPEHGLVAFKGPALPIARSRAAMLHLIAAHGFVATDALRACVARSDDVKTVHVRVHTLRRWLRSQGLPDPIATDRNYAVPGYRWRNDSNTFHAANKDQSQMLSTSNMAQSRAGTATTGEINA